MTDINTEAQFGPREIIPFTDAQWEARAEAQERGHKPTPDDDGSTPSVAGVCVSPVIPATAPAVSGKIPGRSGGKAGRRAPVLLCYDCGSTTVATDDDKSWCRRCEQEIR